MHTMYAHQGVLVICLPPLNWPLQSTQKVYLMFGECQLTEGEIESHTNFMTNIAIFLGGTTVVQLALSCQKVSLA